MTLANGEEMEGKNTLQTTFASSHFTSIWKRNVRFFREPQSAITEGQFVAWYIEDELVGSGVI
jgi:tRNA-specific 2-thiouridylase